MSRETSSPPLAVFLDAAGTLLYPDPPVGEVYAAEAERLGAGVEAGRMEAAFRAAFKEAVKREPAARGEEGEREFWREVVRRVKAALPEARGLPFDPWFEALFEAFARSAAWRLYPDVLPCLRRLKGKGLSLAVVSNWDSRLHGILEGLGVKTFLSAVVLSGEAGARKPDRSIFEAALLRVGVGRAEALHVGDSEEEDIAGARGAGIAALRIDRRPGPAPRPPGVIPSLADLAAMLGGSDGE